MIWKGNGKVPIFTNVEEVERGQLSGNLKWGKIKSLEKGIKISIGYSN